MVEGDELGSMDRVIDRIVAIVDVGTTDSNGARWIDWKANHD